MIHPQLRAEFKAARKDGVRPDQHVVRSVPDMKSFRADLKLAGEDAGRQETGFVDFHSLRKTLSTRMASAGMSQRFRQSHMRHTDPRLTEGTYIDERLLPVAVELAEIPYIPVADTDSFLNAGTNAPNAALGVAPGVAGVAHMHRKTVTLALELATGDMNQQEEIAELVVGDHFRKSCSFRELGKLWHSMTRPGTPSHDGSPKSGRRGSNPRHSRWQRDALPLSYARETVKSL